MKRIGFVRWVIGYKVLSAEFKEYEEDVDKMMIDYHKKYDKLKNYYETELEKMNKKIIKLEKRSNAWKKMNG